MNCPTCGAANEPEARFCAECGAPLESQTDRPVEDDDRTILSTVSQISEEAKTVAVTQEDIAELEADLEQAGEYKSEPPSPPPASPAGGGGSSNTQRYIIIAVVVLLVLCCCCCLLSGIFGYMSNPDIIDEFSFMRMFHPMLAFI
ncbi:MAG: zinc ribbon domain-containing protein [Anaerolineae bacterium]|nr:zinc ribbon domain-containing protein [Anaerolineae bacterium]